MVKLAGKDLFYAHLTEYLDDDLPSSIEKEVKALGETDDGKVIAENFQKNRGWLQMELQNLYLSEDETLNLRRLIGDKEDRQNIEETSISDIGRKVFWANTKRNIGLWGLLVGVIFIFVYFFSPESRTKFNPLQYVEYESIEYENAVSNQMDFPSDDQNEVIAFFQNSQKFSVKPRVLKPFGGGWKLEGASFIDYDTDSMSVVQYGQEKMGEKIFHYAFEGRLDDLPKSAVGDIQGFKYQTYASDQLNIVAWEKDEGLVYLLVGHRGAEELAKFAKTGTSD